MENFDEVIAVCTECLSDQNSARVERDPFYKSGHAPTCQFCGGVTILVERGERDNAIGQVLRQRGIDAS